jgi:hypothetical protein
LAKGDAVTDPNAARIQEYRNRLEAEARKLEAERQRLKQATAALMTEPPEPEPEVGPPPFQPSGYYRPQPAFRVFRFPKRRAATRRRLDSLPKDRCTAGRRRAILPVAKRPNRFAKEPP